MYAESGKAITDADLPQLVKDFRGYNLAGGIPRLFFHLNQAPFNPETRMPAIAECLKLLNPKVTSLNFKWQQLGTEGWIVDLGNNPGLDDISPLTGLDIRILNASNIGTPDLELLAYANLRELRLAGTRINHLPDVKQFADLLVLDIGKTNIRNLSSIVRFSKLATLDISGIEGVAISQQLIWNRNLKLLTVSESFRNDPTIKTLARRGVIIIYSEN
jgi:Leucine-rich repeat (LRR) protein